MSKDKSMFVRAFGKDFLKGFFDEPVHNEDFFSSRVTYTYPVDEAANDPVEYKVVLISSFGRRLEEGLNELGAEGWELKVWEGSRAIFMRFVEDENDAEAEESESEGV